MSTGGAAAFAVILLGLVIGLAVAQPSIQRASDDIKDAREEFSEELLLIQNMDISISSCVLNATTAVMDVTLKNGGMTVWDVEDIHVMVNGTLVSHSAFPSTYCYPNEKLLIRVANTASPSSVMVVGPGGVGATCEV